MLVLSRLPGESVRVGNDVEITVLEVRGNAVKIGIAAPRDVSIYRSELERINRQAASEWKQGGRLSDIAEQLRRRNLKS